MPGQWGGTVRQEERDPSLQLPGQEGVPVLPSTGCEQALGHITKLKDIEATLWEGRTWHTSSQKPQTPVGHR